MIGRAGKAGEATVASRAKSAGRCATRTLPYLSESAFVCFSAVVSSHCQGKPVEMSEAAGGKLAATRRGRQRVEIGRWMGGARLQPDWQRRLRPADHGPQKTIAILAGGPAGPLLDACCARSTASPSPPTTSPPPPSFQSGASDDKPHASRVRQFGLMVGSSLRAREVPGSIPGADLPYRRHGSRS